ncbi:MAG: sugar kinase, partial [Synechococcaceae bacterium WB6_3A_227]|nr:sugar kinase [Synechococcaceae bacterium WB6_3A_227]
MLPIGLGIDLGSSGLRLALVASDGSLLETRQSSYPCSFNNANGWKEGVAALSQQLPAHLREQVVAVAIDGTSGTLLACNEKGEPLSTAIAYSCACQEQTASIKELVPADSAAASASGSLARALRLLEQLRWQPNQALPLLRHQADWLMGWLLGDWAWGEEGNNLRLGWDLEQNSWAGSINAAPWAKALPKIVASGVALGTL